MPGFILRAMFTLLASTFFASNNIIMLAEQGFPYWNRESEIDPNKMKIFKSEL